MYCLHFFPVSYTPFTLSKFYPGAPGRSCSMKGLAGKIAGKMPVDFWGILPSNPPG